MTCKHRRRTPLFTRRRDDGSRCKGRVQQFGVTGRGERAGVDDRWIPGGRRKWLEMILVSRRLPPGGTWGGGAPPSLYAHSSPRSAFRPLIHPPTHLPTSSFILPHTPQGCGLVMMSTRQEAIAIMEALDEKFTMVGEKFTMVGEDFTTVRCSLARIHTWTHRYDANALTHPSPHPQPLPSFLCSSRS